MIKTKECGEPLIDIKKVCPMVVVCLGKDSFGRERKAFFRESVARMICDAKKMLPNDMTFIIRDAWRPQSLQKEIFAQFIDDFSKKYPNWTRDRIINEVNKYVAPFEGRYVSGHMTGGAVDLRLLKNGRRVPMRSLKLSYQENAKSIQPKLPKYIQRNREIMFDALSSVGLSNYPKEFWHWSYGDIWWAKRNKKKIAIYGMVKEL